MKIEDPLHGDVEITEPVLVDLLKTPEMARLKHIEMGGYAAAFFPGATYFSRYEHSVGVALLLMHAGAPLEEQIFGLLHDVNHTVYSHAIDYAVAGGSEEGQDYQDRHFVSFLEASTIPPILERHGHDVRALYDKRRFPLAENDIPDLCADRIDYSLRSMLHYGTEQLGTVKRILSALQSDGRSWFFGSLQAAARFGTAFARIDDAVFDAFPSAIMYRSIGDCVAAALQNGVIGEQDILSTDAEVTEKISAAAEVSPLLKVYWQRMSGLSAAVPSNGSAASRVTCKSRIVDPLLRDGRGLIRLSEKVPAWRAIVDEGRKPKTYEFIFVD